MSDILLKPNFQQMPEELKQRPQWVVWKLVPDGDKKPRKTPVDPKTGRNAKANDPSTWGTYDQALELYTKRMNDFAGIGYEFSADDPYVGIDLDKAVNGSGPLPWASEIISELNSYTELSPSGSGYHILVRGKLPPGGRKNGHVEMYDRGRFFTMTGSVVNGLAAIEDRAAQVAKVHARVFPGNGQKPSQKPPESTNRKSAPLDEASVLKHAGRAKNGEKFKRLWGGDISGHNSLSEADLALCNMLAFWTRKDPALMDSLFCQSGLWREKWDEVHRPADGATYGAMTIEKAIADCTDVYEGPRERVKRSKSNPSGDPDVTEEAIDGFPWTEDGVALAFTERFKDELRYCHHTGAWFHWDGSRWEREETKLAFSWARNMCRDLGSTAEKMSVKMAIGKAAFAAAVERFAQADRAHAVTSEIWDRDTWLLGTPQGVVDLRTGELRAARQDDYITKQTSVAPATSAHAPVWSRFLGEATKGDQGLQRFLQQMAGYCLTGDIREHALFFVYGPGGNGKSVFLTALMNIMAGYASTSAMDAFTASKNDKHPTDLAMLKGARLVSVSETEEGRAWAESRIKQLTGGDEIAARFMRQDFFRYKPQFKLLIVGNHKPVLRNVDDAARRRFNIIPFIHKPGAPDKQLEEKLKIEYPAILRWMIEGCIDWQRNGLMRPSVVTEATQAYFDDQDLFGQWIEECCEIGPREWEVTSRLFASWKDYADRSGEQPGSVKAFSANLSKREFNPELKRVSGVVTRLYRGISLKSPQGERKPYAD
jgi:P4 family phage/plasmid primase-like protien